MLLTMSSPRLVMYFCSYVGEHFLLRISIAVLGTYIDGNFSSFEPGTDLILVLILLFLLGATSSGQRLQSVKSDLGKIWQDCSSSITQLHID